MLVFPALAVSIAVAVTISIPIAVAIAVVVIGEGHAPNIIEDAAQQLGLAAVQHVCRIVDLSRRITNRERSARSARASTSEQSAMGGESMMM